MNDFINAVKGSIEQAIAGIHTSMPGKILAYDPQTNKARVQPALKMKVPDGRMIDMPVIVGVPVMFPKGMSGQASITWPLAEGDDCMLFFAERSIDDYVTGGESDDPRKHDLTDAIAYPGCSATGIPSMIEHPKALCIRLGNTTLRIEGGNVIIENGDLIIDGISFKQHSHPESIGSVTGPPS